jgi:hypothetical protein
MSERLKYVGPAIVAASELAATGIAVKSYLEGNPMPVHDLIALYSFWTFYIGIPAGIVAHAVLHIADHFRTKATQFPQSPEFPQSPNIT